ncbi:two-component sensor histidine kinase [Solitalea longa]|uniref:histidine kinase n=1 Tax=Solitalea longa TaxID=2079460 RepID=A0A2S5A0E7_9SPHI|nr:HAMP domain-containing sensor histidine kinase [Solitalea longa]POY35737.1 two-component sensor histidine kinase [Solitalea longa]
MKLLTKLTLFITLSKLVIVALFVALLPTLIENIAFQYTNYYLREQKDKVMSVVNRNGVDFYLQGDSSYGSYTMLKEEYISLEPAQQQTKRDTIETTQRIVERDTLNYRVLSHTFNYSHKNYILEIGKTTSSINQYNDDLQRVALYVLITLVIITIVIDLVFTRFLLRPLGLIIKTKLLNRRFPFKEQPPAIKTTTVDFKLLDDSFIKLMDQIHETFEKEREFTANASHELMTPISILQTKMENLMVESELDEQFQSRLLEMMKTLSRLKKIVHSLLLISRIENEQFARAGSIAVKTLLNDVVEDLDHRLEEKALTIVMNVSDEVTINNINSDLIFQLIYNLINNAIRYNKSGGTIEINEVFEVDSYSINIKDTGIGIPEHELSTIFNRFKKANRSGNEGYGLGLAIVKSIINYHNLQLKVQSDVGQGTVFSIFFPLEMMDRSNH